MFGVAGADFAYIHSKSDPSSRDTVFPMTSQQFDDEAIFNIARKLADTDAQREYLDRWRAAPVR